jgi:hypothetical protein
MILMDNFIERGRSNMSFIRNKHQISRLLDYHNLYPRLYNLDNKFACLAII